MCRQGRRRFGLDRVPAWGRGRGHGEQPTAATSEVDWSTLSARHALERLAVAADRQAVAAPSGHFYRYQRSESAYLSMRPDLPPVLAAKTRREWIGSDGSGRIWETAGEPRFLSEEDRQAWQAVGESPSARPIRQDFGPGELTWLPAGLLREPGALEARLRAQREREEQQRAQAIADGEAASRRTEAPVGGRMFTAVSDLLRAPALPPELLAALLRVTAGIDGLDYLGLTPDPAERPAIGFAALSDRRRLRHELFFDPDTGQLLAEREIALAPLEGPGGSSAQPPIVIGEVVYLENGIVGQLPR